MEWWNDEEMPFALVMLQTAQAFDKKRFLPTMDCDGHWMCWHRWECICISLKSRHLFPCGHCKDNFSSSTLSCPGKLFWVNCCQQSLHGTGESNCGCNHRVQLLFLKSTKRHDIVVVWAQTPTIKFHKFRLRCVMATMQSQETAAVVLLMAPLAVFSPLRPRSSSRYSSNHLRF